MKILNRKIYSKKSDYQKLWNFIIENYRFNNEDTTWTIGRLSDWKHGLWHSKKLDPSFMCKNCQAWTDAFDDFVGIAISEEGDSLFHLFAKPNYRLYLYDKMLDFVEENWKERENRLHTEIPEDNLILCNILEKRGYIKRPASHTTEYDLQNFKVTLDLPKGFSVVNMEENGDQESKLMLYKSGFENKNTFEAWDLVTFRYNRESPAYNPEFDFSVIDEKGKHVSGCVCFIDFENCCAEVEKVCTHKDYRRRGLSSGLIQRALMKLKEIGIKKAYITGYTEEAKSTYKKVGPVSCKINYDYEKKF